MANTPNLNLEKPLGTDKALVARINSNMDKIDTFAGSTNQALSNLIPATGTTYTGDLNDLPTGRVYTGPGVTNAPTNTNYWFVDTIVYSTSAVQYAQDRNAAVNVWTRNKSAGTWREWKQLAFKEELGGLTMLNKLSTSSAADLTFTASGRGAGFLIVTQNGLQSSIYEIHTISNSGALQFTKIGGRDATITANDNVLTVSVTNWSNVYVIFGGSIS